MSYYDPYPSMYLAKPKVLIGPLGGGIGVTGAMVSALTGLPFMDLDRLVEHAFGLDFRDVVTQHGWEAWRECEYTTLSRVLDQRPAGIIILGEGALDQDRTRRLVLERSDGWYLARNVFDTFGRLKTVWDTHYLRFPNFLEMPTLQDLQKLQSQRTAGYHTLPNAEDVSGIHPNEVARWLVDRWDV